MLEVCLIRIAFSMFTRFSAELNIPYYPLLRRKVDCIIALDASADSQDLWFTRAEGESYFILSI